MSELADYIVIRPAADLPAGFLPESYDGKWFDVRDVPKLLLRPPDHPNVSEAVAIPTGRFETREDGAVAEVWEVRP